MICRGKAKAMLLVAFILLVVGLNAYWFLFGEFLRVARPLRLTAGACLIFLLPGLVWAELFGLRARSVLEAIALSFGLTLTLEIALLAVVVPFHLPIAAWTAGLLAVTGLGSVVLAWRVSRGTSLGFAAPLIAFQRSRGIFGGVQAFLTLVPFLLAVLAYRWGEVVGDLGGEKYVHLMFVRFYFQMPLALHDLGISPNLPPPNLIHLWEFLLAGWARCIQTDPLPLFYHARFVVPILGLAGMYLLTRMVFLSRRSATATFAVVLVLCLSRLVLDGSSLAWVRATDSTRGVFAFMGSAHHADTAMDILLPLTAGIILWWMRKPSWAGAALVAGTLGGNFLWHPREFLQASLYLGLFGGAAVLLPSLRRAIVWKRWSAAVAVLGAVALTCMVLSTVLIPRESHGYDEVALKHHALTYALRHEHWAHLRNLFNYPFHFCLSFTDSPDAILSSAEMAVRARGVWHLDLWLFLAAGSTILLGVFGRPRDRQLAFYHLLCWVLVYAWNTSMLLLLSLTYSEFFHTTPRILYLFTYLVIARGLLLLGSLVLKATQRASEFLFPSRARYSAIALGCSMVVMAGFGWALHIWLAAGKPAAPLVATALSTGCYALFLLILPGCRPWRPAAGVPTGAALCLALAGLLPLTGAGIGTLFGPAVPARPGELAWFRAANPFGYSPPLVDWLVGLPPGHVLLTNPLHGDVPCVYSAQYLAIHGTGSIIKDIPEVARIREGRHPIWLPPGQPGRETNPVVIDHQQAVEWLRNHRVDFVLIRREDHTAEFLHYFQSHPKDFELRFHNPMAHEIVFQFLDRAPSQTEER